MPHRHEQIRFNRPHHHLTTARTIHLPTHPLHTLSAQLLLPPRLAARHRLPPLPLDHIRQSKIVHRLLQLSFSLLDRPTPYRHNILPIVIIPTSCGSILRIVSRRLDTSKIDIFFAFTQYRLPLALLPVLPKTTIVEVALAIIELPISLAVVVLKITFVAPSILPSIDSVACLFIHCVVPLIHLYTFAALFPNSVAVTKTLLEITFKGTTICPNILTIPFRLSVHILPFIDIAVYEPLCTLSMFQTIFEYSDIEISIQFLMQSLAIGQASPPFAFIVLYEIISLLIFG